MKLHRIFHQVTGGKVFAEPCSTLCCTRVDQVTVEMSGKVLVDQVSLHLHCGEILALIGPNGAGKSTLLRALAGEIPFRGLVGFLDANGGKVRQYQLGYVPQSPRFEKGSPVTVMDLFAATLTRRPLWLGTSSAFRTRVHGWLRTADCEDLLDQRLGDLSGGETQRVLLALALEPKPNLLLLDEPVSGVDHAGREKFYQVVDRLRQTMDLGIIMVSHDFEAIKNIADRVVLLDKKALCTGTVGHVFSSEPFKKIFGHGVTP